MKAKKNHYILVLFLLVSLQYSYSQPTLSSPSNNAEYTKGSSLSFSWSSVSNASYYEIWIDNNSGFGSPEVGLNNGASSNWVNNGIVSSNSFSLTTNMQNQLPQNVYYWRVRALKSNQTPLTDWSTPVRGFSLLDAPPNPPTLSSPSNNAEHTKGSSLSFSWSSVSNASYYEIWIDNNSGFGSPEVGLNNGASSNWVNNGIVSSNSFSLTTNMQNQLPQNVYYWKVRALNNSMESISDWSSETRCFILYNNFSNPQAWGYPCDKYIPGSYNGRTFYYDQDHLGEDILLSEGTPIYSIGDGIVKIYRASDGYGELAIVIEHHLGEPYTFKNSKNEDVTTTYILSIYGHLRKSKEKNGNQLNINVGDFVKKGQLIGYVENADSNGDGTEHLHMGIRLSDASTAISNDIYWFRGYEKSTDFGKDFAAFSKVILQLSNRYSTLELLSPQTGYEHTKGTNLSFSWLDVAEVAYYEIWIDNNSGFGSPEIGFNNGSSYSWINDGIVNINSFTLTPTMQNALPQNVYYWKVRALDSVSNPLTEWSTVVRSFVLRNEMLAAPTTFTPSDSTVFTKGNELHFTWSNVNSAAYYELWIDNNSGFGSPEIGFNNGANINWINDGIVNNNFFELTPDLQTALPQNVYYWKVRALDSEKNPLSDWSSFPMRFVLLDSVSCTTPSLPDSIIGSKITCTGMTYDYSVPPIGGATSYVWTLPNGAVGVSSSNRISVYYGALAFSGVISVKGVNDCGDGEANSIFITINQKPETPYITLSDQTLYSNAIYGNQWYNQAGIISGATNQQYSVVASGDYYVIVTQLDCSSDSSNVITVNVTSTDLIAAIANVKIFPNPFSNELNILFEDNNENINIEIINFLGQTVYRGLLYEKLTLKTLEFSSGIYIVRIENSNHVIFTKIIKQ